MAIPISDITVRTSAKSTLIKPGRVIKSEIPFTAPSNTLFAALNALSKLIFFPKTLNNLLLGIVINESTCSAKRRIPSSAASALCFPSKENGLVTTATVKIPNSLAISAKTGAAPVPVPPPIPAVIKTISAPLRISLMCSLSSSAASLPICGLAPAPKPLVNASPN